MARRRPLEAALLVLAAATCVRADSGPSPSVGFLKDVYVSTPTRIDWRFVVRNIPDDEEGPSNPGAHRSYDPRKQRYQLYVPENYTSTKAWPLIVFINSISEAKTWPYWQKPCEELGMLYCEAESAGNGCSNVRRTRIVLDMLDDVRRHYRIDPLQTYVSGQSGGGRMACHVGFALPEYFGGVMPICGSEPFSWSTPYLRHRICERQAVAFINGDGKEGDFVNRHTNESYMAPLFRELGAKSKQWTVKGMGHSNAPPEILTEALRWLTADLPRRQADAKVRPQLSVAPDEAPTAGQQAAGQLEAARAEAMQPERLWHAAALAQGVLGRWGRTPSAEPARRFLETLQNDPQRANLLARQRKADEWLARTSRARARESYSGAINQFNGMPFGGKMEACKDWQELARDYAQTPEGKKAEAEAKRLEAAIAAAPKLAYLGAYYIALTWKVARVDEDGPAGKAGLRPGDLVRTFDGEKVKSRQELWESIQKHKPGDTVLMEIIRNNKPLTLTIQLGGRIEGTEDNFLPDNW